MSSTTPPTTATCPVCQSTNAKMWRSGFYEFEAQPYHLSRCPACSLIFVSPMPSDDCIARMYGDQYFQEDFIASRYTGDYEEIFRKRKHEFEDILRKIDSVIAEKKGVFFEIGAAGGAMLRSARDYGWKTQGLEISKWGSEHCRDKYHLDVKRGNFLQTNLPPEAHQVIFLGDVFEHFVDPSHALKKIHSALQSGGYIVLMLPMYISSWCFKIFMALQPFLRALSLPAEFSQLLKIQVDKKNHQGPPYHVYEYSKKTIARLLNSHNFEVRLIKGNLPIPESLTINQPRANALRRLVVGFALFSYKLVKWTSENFNFPLVRALVIAQKK